MKIQHLVLATLLAVSHLTTPLFAQTGTAGSRGPCGNGNNGGGGGGGGDNTNTPPGDEGDPVIPYTGNEFKMVDDLQIWGAVGNYPMVWSRHSNSRAVPGASLFGTAHYWRHSFQWELSATSKDASGRARMTLVFPDGATFTYTEVAPNLWSIGGTSADFLKRTDSGFVLQTKDSYRYNFKVFPSGTSFYYLLTEVLDPSGNRFALEYDSSRRLVSVREPGGRFFQVSYSTLTGNKLTPATLATLGSKPASGSWIDLPVTNNGTYRYVRVVQADGSFGNIAEIEVYEAGTNTKLSGSVICSDSLAQGTKAMDGDPTTSFQSTSYSGGFVGIKLPAGKKIGRVRILPAAGTENLHKPTNGGYAALKVEGSNEASVSATAISKVETSDGRAVNYSYTNIVDPTLPYVFPALTSVIFGDGSKSEYRLTRVFPGTRPLISEWDDVRYALRQGRYKTVYQSNQTGAVLGAVYAQVNLETGKEILRIGLKSNNLHQPMVTFANGGNVVQYYGANKPGANAITRRDDANGNPTIYTFDATTGYTATEKDPLGRITAYAWTDKGQMA